MSDRLTRAFPAFRRSLQVSNNSVFILVEGKKVDPYFYGSIARDVCLSKGITWSTRIAAEISGHGGGKEVLLSLFEYLRNRSALFEDFKGKKMVVIFFLDKDVDDILRTTRRSSHVVYTIYYDVYNHLFAEGDISKGLAAAASLDPHFIESQIPDCQVLRRQLAEQWKDWVKLCLFTAKKKVNCQSNYRLTSQINVPACGPLDPARHEGQLQGLKRRLKLTDRQFNRSFKRVSELVDGHYSDGRHDCVFKGRWYCHLFADYTRRLDATADCNGLADRLPSTIASNLDFGKPWADHFKRPLIELLLHL